jgi:hypothetical protein
VGEIWAADLAILPEMQKGSRYILVVMEYLTRWAVTVALPPMESEVIATVLLYEVVLKFGTPKRLITENGSNLTSDVMNTMTKSLQIRHATTSVEHPQTDGLVERLNPTTLKTCFSGIR